MKIVAHLAALSLGFITLAAEPVTAGQEPRGLILRKGLVSWQATVQEATKFVEADVRPNIPVLIRGAKPASFGCEQEGTQGITHCTWACCVDLGEKDIVHFATLWFYKDRFYAYDIVFNIAQFGQLYASLTSQFGPPSRETQETELNRAALFGGVGTYVVNTKRWDAGKTVILLSDRGGRGSPVAGHIYVTYLPLAHEAAPTAKTDSQAGSKLPF